MACDDGLNGTLLIQEQRHQHLKEACEALQLKPWSAKQYRIAIRASGVFYVDDSLRYVYCMVPMAACTTWIRALLIASGQVGRRIDYSLLWNSGGEFQIRCKIAFRRMQVMGVDRGGTTPMMQVSQWEVCRRREARESLIVETECRPIEKYEWTCNFYNRKIRRRCSCWCSAISGQKASSGLFRWKC